jgi:hypothetical protein
LRLGGAVRAVPRSCGNTRALAVVDLLTDGYLGKRVAMEWVMTSGLVTDDEIASLSDAQRSDLIRRLEAGDGPSLPAAPMRGRVRAAHLGLLIGSAAALIPWTAYLAVRLPANYTAYNWDTTWVGFDVILLVLLATTVTLALMQRRLVMGAAFATGVVILCDAWFDVMTAGPGDFWPSLATAAFIELPIAAVLVRAAFRVYRLDRLRPSLFR